MFGRPNGLAILSDVRTACLDVRTSEKSVTTTIPSPHLSPLPPLAAAAGPLLRALPATQVNQSTGPFHALLCVGQFFSPEADAEGAPGDVADYLEGRAAVPIPTTSPATTARRRRGCCRRQPLVLDPHGYDPVVAELVAEIKPRYHIAGTKGVFYSREQYVNDSSAHLPALLDLLLLETKKSRAQHK
ncbi:Zinc finger CCCH domain-containing protein 59 [Panicum miliaceum]|uniref:Zinc finger CCCH domain-containing protein 59 n=1 Tax=Panicum miliaceum TaxID=4540 RepID=A0A3L6TGU2_PANMI|nr:Zinc finger CCCH domain-containing protein 59 [Panicum miliaceum]